MELPQDVWKHIVNIAFVCPKCKDYCFEFPCFLDDLCELQHDPEWVFTYGRKYEGAEGIKTFRRMWRRKEGEL